MNQGGGDKEQRPTPRTDEVTLGEWEYGRDEDGNKRVAALDYEVLRDLSRQLERELAHARDEWKRYMDLSCQQAGDQERNALSPPAPLMCRFYPTQACTCNGVSNKPSDCT